MPDGSYKKIVAGKGEEKMSAQEFFLKCIKKPVKKCKIHS
jgi:hypothetical protein